MAAMLHDLYAYKTGSYDDHAHKGAELAGKILKKLELTDEVETEKICSAIYHHDDKMVTDGAMEEALKDADVLKLSDFAEYGKPAKIVKEEITKPEHVDYYMDPKNIIKLLEGTSI